MPRSQTPPRQTRSRNPSPNLTPAPVSPRTITVTYPPPTNSREIRVTSAAWWWRIASVSLPVSVNTQGTYLNQVFVGMFRPDGDAAPRWYGNLKQYKLAAFGTDIRTVQSLLGHTDVSTTMIYLHVMKRPGAGAPSPLDHL